MRGVRLTPKLSCKRVNKMRRRRRRYRSAIVSCSATLGGRFTGARLPLLHAPKFDREPRPQRPAYRRVLTDEVLDEGHADQVLHGLIAEGRVALQHVEDTRIRAVGD